MLIPMLPPRHVVMVAMLLIASACGARQKDDGGPRMRTTPAPWTLSYADGAANQYRFSQGADGAPVAFEYIPVTPEQSSTGHYSGGDPVSTRLPADDPRIAELWRRVDALGADPALLVEDRNKGTGAFHMTTSARERRFIVEMGAALAEFDAFVRKFRAH
jgi:hypothetical protein